MRQTEDVDVEPLVRLLIPTCRERAGQPTVTAAGLIDAFETTSHGNRLVALAQTLQPFRLGGVRSSARAIVLAVLARHMQQPFLWITSTEEEAERLAEDSKFFLATGSECPVRVLVFPERELSMFDEGTTDPQRLTVLEALLEKEPVVVVSSVVALLQRTAAPQKVRQEARTLAVSGEADMDSLLRRLLAHGYNRTTMVEHRGQVSRRGGIFDIYPATGDPVRVEFFGDTVDSIRTFNLDTQRSIASLQQVSLFPMREDDRRAFLTAYLPPMAPLVMDEPSRIKLRLDELTADLGGTPRDCWSEVLQPLAGSPRVDLTSWGATEADVDVFIPTEGVPGFSSHVEDFAQYALQRAAAGELVWVVTHQAPRLRHILQRADEHGLVSDTARAGHVTVLHGQLIEGVRIDGTLCLVTDREILGVARRQRYATPSERGSMLRLEDLKVGDAVVHVSHGIGRFDGIRTLEILGSSRDFLSLAYARGDSVFVPIEQMQSVSKYVGTEGKPPTLSRLGRAEWRKTRQQVAEQIKEMANQLLRLYANRKAHAGFSYSPDGPWMEDLEAAFSYDETPDQDRAIEAAKRDMEDAMPMDRLVCGDVGYGKTEIAVRAAFKAVLDGRQVAVLVPTTILAQQHHQTFRERLEPFPVRIEVLSRFRTAKEQREVVAALRTGEVDVVIGTHRLLQADVSFKNLGLVVVDEEQHFGVEHKEKLKELKTQVDCMTLTATPIPRTLQMSLVGVRDLSLIETPPEARLPIKTYLFEAGPEVVKGAITRELDRGGQVFFVHNRVRGIDKVAGDVQALVPQARIAVGHGQMSEGRLEQVITDFIAGEHDILVCTTIIESGVDMPNVNTIVVNNAHTFGLGALYQLRGRVGRSSAQAYCYLLYPPHQTLTREAEMRLETIRDFTALGSGYQIALRDLEIRGAGNLLGEEQSGHIAEVGFNLYCQMLEEAVAEAKAGRGESWSPRALEVSAPVLELPVEAFVPDEYVSDPRQKITIYRRLAETLDIAALDDIGAEMRDRFGPLPDSVRNLLRFVRLKITAVQMGVPSVKFRENCGERVVVCLLPFVKMLDRRKLARVGEVAEASACFKDHQLILSGFGGRNVDWVETVLRALDWIGGQAGT